MAAVRGKVCPQPLPFRRLHTHSLIIARGKCSCKGGGDFSHIPPFLLKIRPGRARHCIRLRVPLTFARTAAETAFLQFLRDFYLY